MEAIAVRHFSPLESIQRPILAVSSHDLRMASSVRPDLRMGKAAVFKGKGHLSVHHGGEELALWIAENNAPQCDYPALHLANIPPIDANLAGETSLIIGGRQTVHRALVSVVFTRPTGKSRQHYAFAL